MQTQGARLISGGQAGSLAIKNRHNPTPGPSTRASPFLEYARASSTTARSLYEIGQEGFAQRDSRAPRRPSPPLSHPSPYLRKGLSVLRWRVILYCVQLYTDGGSGRTTDPYRGIKTDTVQVRGGCAVPQVPVTVILIGTTGI